MHRYEVEWKLKKHGHERVDDVVYRSAGRNEPFKTSSKLNDNRTEIVHVLLRLSDRYVLDSYGQQLCSFEPEMNYCTSADNSGTTATKFRRRNMRT